LELALSATAAEDSPPRIAAFIRRPAGGIRSGLREVEHRVVPRSQALSAALDYALEREAAIVPQATWTEAPARDIVRLATEIQAAWILMGFHRPVFGADFRGGVVGQVVEQVANFPINVGVVINETRNPGGRISAVIDRSPDGWAALDLATRVAQRRNCELEVIWVPSASNDAAELDEMLSAVATRVPRINTVMLEVGAATAIKEKNLSNLVVIGASLIGPLKFAEELRAPQRCTIVVQGTAAGLGSATTSATAAVASR
jgi:nucleotide-binding universal stress UspA family protein